MIGSNVKLISASVINAVGCAQRLCLHTGPNGRLTLEDHVGISNSVLFAAKNITIHHHTIIGGGCALYDTDFHELLPEDRNPRSYYVRTAPVSIGPHAFVGGHTIILKGVSIGEGALVAAGSVVTKSVPPFEVWAGNPARFARQLDSTLKMNRNLEGS